MNSSRPFLRQWRLLALVAMAVVVAVAALAAGGALAQTTKVAREGGPRAVMATASWRWLCTGSIGNTRVTGSRLP
jgi:hypothetical protein